MPRIIDRYMIREIIPPFLLALLVFTFVLIIPFIIDLAEQMIAKGVPAGTILQLTITLLPQALALTIPMALLIGLLVGLGRLSSDREFVVMMACGISPYRLLQPMLVFAVVCWGLTSWVMLEAMPDGNQTFREISTEIAMNRAEGEVRPRVFFEDFPNVVLYVREIPTNGQGWLGVLAADTSNPSTADDLSSPSSGRMVVDRAGADHPDGARGRHAAQHQARGSGRLRSAAVRPARSCRSIPKACSRAPGPPAANASCASTIWRRARPSSRAQGISPHNPIMEIHRKFSIPVACFVFARARARAWAPATARTASSPRSCSASA